MIKYCVFVLLMCVSCFNNRNAELISKEELSGNWIILYPQHILKTDAQRKIYGKAQDSIVDLMGLKLISFKSNGEFLQTDSLFGDTGNWMLADSGRLNIRSAGKGFENFRGTVVGIVNDTILIDEIVPFDKERIKLIWHFKKISPGSEASKLFKQDNNGWRQKPAQKQTGDEIKTKVIAMLRYYGLYYKLVAKESIYFTSSRVALPFRYYQHGVGLKVFEPDHQFASCFFDTGDALKGYEFIQKGFRKIENDDFPSGENYVAEYARYFDMLAKAIE